jgi:two-component system, NarL family, sensor kinase
MRKKINFVLLFYFFHLASFSQEMVSNDSSILVVKTLKNELSLAKSDSLKCILNYKLAGVFFQLNNTNKYQYYYKQGNKYKKKNQFLNSISVFYNSYNYFIKGDINKFKENLEEARIKLKKSNDKASKTYYILTLNNQTKFLNNEQSVKLLLNEAIPISKKINDSVLIARSYLSVAISFFDINDFNKAEFYINLSIKHFKNITKNTEVNYLLNIDNLSESYLLLGEIYLYKKDYVKSHKFLEKAKWILKNSPYSNLNLTYYLIRSHHEFENGKIENALKTLNLGIDMCLKTNQIPFIQKFKLAKFTTLKELKRYKEAKEILFEVLNSEYIGIDEKKDFIRDLASLYAEVKDFPNAIVNYERYIHLNDSINENEYNKEIVSLEAKFKNEEKEKQITVLKAEKQKAIWTAENNKLYYILFGLTSILLLSISFFLFKNNQNQKNLSKQKEINFNQNLEKLNAKKNVEVMQAMINGEEAERKRIARDLHDGIGSRLSSLKMQIGETKVGEKGKIDYPEIATLLSISISELRQTAFNLVPETLLKLGLEMALKDLCFSMSTNTVNIHFLSNGEINNINKSNQLTVFRIIQELINNALKHANCSEIIVDCSRNKNIFLMTIEDNGIGFNTNDIKDFSGLGIKNIQSRVELLKGKLDINSNSKKGTSINIEFSI